MFLLIYLYVGTIFNDFGVEEEGTTLFNLNTVLCFGRIKGTKLLIDFYKKELELKMSKFAYIHIIAFCQILGHRNHSLTRQIRLFYFPTFLLPFISFMSFILRERKLDKGRQGHNLGRREPRRRSKKTIFQPLWRYKITPKWRETRKEVRLTI